MHAIDFEKPTSFNAPSHRLAKYRCFLSDTNYPYQAIEEALVNAFYHRSYEDLNPIEVNIRPDRIEILSFPGPLPPLNQDMLHQRNVVPRSYRNRRIGDFFKELELTEGRGTGFPTIHDELARNGSLPPEFVTDEDRTYFLTTIYIHPVFKTTNLANFSEKTREKMKTILDYCKTPKSRKEILDHIGLANNTQNHRAYVLPLIEQQNLDYTIPENITDKRQQYIATDKEID